MTPPSTIDAGELAAGTFGPSTEAAVRDWQPHHVRPAGHDSTSTDWPDLRLCGGLSTRRAYGRLRRAGSRWAPLEARAAVRRLDGGRIATVGGNEGYAVRGLVRPLAAFTAMVRPCA